jgi:hypothetical protein
MIAAVIAPPASVSRTPPEKRVGWTFDQTGARADMSFDTYQEVDGSAIDGTPLMPRSAAMAMVGRKTESIYRRSAIVDAGVLREAAAAIAPRQVLKLPVTLCTILVQTYRLRICESKNC